MKKILLFNVCSIIMITSLFSQAMFVDEGNAYGFMGLYQSEEIEGGKSTTLAGMGTYLLNGNLEFGIEYDILSMKNDTDSELDINGTGIGFNGMYHIKNESLPFVLKLGGMYGTGSFDADFLTDLGITMTSKSSGFGGGIYKMVSETESFSITPFVNFTSMKSEVKMKDSSDSITTDDDFNVFSFGVAVKMNNNIWIQPTIGQVDGESSFSIVVGTYFLQK